MKCKLFISAAVLLAVGCSHRADETALKIMFDTPIVLHDGTIGGEWESQTLPLGNGNMGINIAGSTDVECITFNEKSLWRGGPAAAARPEHYWDANKHSAPLLDLIRRSFTEDGGKRADELVRDNFNGTVPYEAEAGKPFLFGSFTTAGEFRIDTGLDTAGITRYRRELNIDDARAEVSFDKDGVHYRREFFVSYPANTVVMRFSADRKGAQNLTFDYLPNAESVGEMTPEGDNGLLWRARLANNGMEYVVRIRARVKGGTLDNSGGRLLIASADEALFTITADTDYAPVADPDIHDAAAYVGADPEATTRAWADRASGMSYKALLDEHLADYHALYGRVRLSLNPSAVREDIPTPQRLERYREGTPDFYLEELYYQYGRYLLIASSREGNLPANLQGVWSRGIDAPWHADYHNNINLQMNYWPACPTNLAECEPPLFDFILTQTGPGARTAREYFNARGWTAWTMSNPFGFTSPVTSKDMSWNLGHMAGPWLATMLWDYYDYTRDTDFLRTTAYPAMRGAALFAADCLWLKPDGTYTAAPSTSPEHGPISEGTTFSHAVVREMLLDAIAAAEILDTDAELREEWQHVLDNIAPYEIGRYGQLKEWAQDIDDPEDHHRHVNHLFGLHPGRTISPLTTPELAEAARVVLNHRGDGATGWSMGWKLNQWARLHDGNRAYKLYGNLLREGTLDNLWDTHPPFQIDGNFGGTAGVTEMLMQSHAGCIHLLPALPEAWAEGSVEGLCARGAFETDIYWSQGRLTRAVIRSRAGGLCTVLCDGCILSFDTVKGGSYTLTATDGELKLK